MKSNESQNTKIAEQILVKRFSTPSPSGIHFFIDQLLTDCQSNAVIGGGWIRYARNFEKRYECSGDVTTNRDKIDKKEVRT
jgi:hypothetical protein